MVGVEEAAREEELRAVTAWLVEHADWVGVIMFGVLFVEALPPVGFFVPLSVIMLGVGALVGTQALPWMPVLLGAVMGAIAGTSVTYGVARHYRTRLLGLPVLRTRARWVARASRFFARYGGLALFGGRFTKPLRLSLPLVAGVSGMRPLPFLLYNVLSALSWVSVYLMLGGVVGRVAAYLGLELAGALLVAVLLVWIGVRTWQRRYAS
ncbi:DedA family protein [Ectothiorhodospiraceae bacterium 2226]|nr:DedA family protein [Ectothiorhodospiraceae bacterium 2226]